MQSVKNATKKNSNKIRNYLLRMNIEKNVNFRRTRREIIISGYKNVHGPWSKFERSFSSIFARLRHP